MRYALSKTEWKIIRPILPTKSRGVPRVDDRRVLNGIFWVLRSGAPWRDLLDRYGPYTTCYNRFVRWRRADVWDRLFDALADLEQADLKMIDSTVLRVQQHGASVRREAHHCTGRSRGGLTTKIHAVVDRQGLPLRFTLSAGQEHDSLKALDLLRGLLGDGMLLADKACDANAVRAFARSEGGWANIPPRRTRKDLICFSPFLYRARNRIERFFNRIKQCRRIATRYDKLAENFLAFVKLAAIRLWLAVNESTP
jgi:transposase